jgi:transcriptional regulator with GAF, ATPase, and Fis domain
MAAILALISVVLVTATEARASATETVEAANKQTLRPHIVGESAAMQRLLRVVARIGPKDITVLVRGETGTGKELIASLVHARSARASAPLVTFNCAAIPGELAEAELFGHARGAFTGAVEAREGFFAKAHGGTLVLDEVGELPAPIQAKLLRVLQEGEIQPVGAGRVERVDVRIIACTNRNLSAEARAGRFREDLYYRLAVVELVIPPLRNRREEIPALAAEFARRYGQLFGKQDARLSPSLIEALCKAPWPGNVRELENAIARMVALGTGAEIGVDAFASTTRFAPAAPETTAAAGGAQSLRLQIEALERSAIARALATAGGNQSAAARQLGLARGTLMARLRKYGLVATTANAAGARPRRWH